MTIRLPAGLRGYIRNAAESLLTDTCTIEQNTSMRGEYGETVEQWSVVASGTACRVITLGSRFREVAGAGTQGGKLQREPEISLGREFILDSYRLVVPAGTDLDVDYRVTLSNGDVYTVVDLVTERTDETDRQAVIIKAR